MKKLTIGICILSIIIGMTFVLGAGIDFDTVHAQQTLYWGARGDDVREVQQKLKNRYFFQGNVDGVFGQATYDAVIRFQKKNGLVVDGVVGAETYRELGLYRGGSSSSSSKNNNQNANKNTDTSTRNSDVELLARAITGEARGEAYNGQVAVGAVVLNRVKNPNFPNTIAGVVYQPGAFTAVSDGQINVAVQDSCRKAARDALNGWDPTYGCIYYWNPATATSKWIWSRKVSVKLGKHWFAY